MSTIYLGNLMGATGPGASGATGPTGPRGVDGTPGGATGPTGPAGPGSGGVGSEISFYAHRSGVSQSISASSYTVVGCTHTDINTGSCFDTGTSRFTPTTAGRYFLTASAQMDDIATNEQYVVSIRKNGTDIVRTVMVTYAGFSDPTMDLGTLVEANGSTDYFELIVWHDDPAGTRSLFGTSSATFFAGFLVSGGPGETGASGPDFVGASTDTINLSSLTVGDSISLTVSSGEGWVANQTLLVYSADAAHADQWVIIKVTDYNSTSLSGKILQKSGTSNISSWTIFLTGEQGLQGATGPVGSAGSTGATGPRGPEGPCAIRNYSGNTVSLGGGTTDLDCTISELFDCELNNNSTLRLTNVSLGQRIFVKVKTMNPVRTLQWTNPPDGVLYWQGGNFTQTNVAGSSTLYEIIKFKEATGTSVYLGVTKNSFAI